MALILEAGFEDVVRSIKMWNLRYQIGLVFHDETNNGAVWYAGNNRLVTVSMASLDLTAVEFENYSWTPPDVQAVRIWEHLFGLLRGSFPELPAKEWWRIPGETHRVANLSIAQMRAIVPNGFEEMLTASEDELKAKIRAQHPDISENELVAGYCNLRQYIDELKARLRERELRKHKTQYEAAQEFLARVEVETRKDDQEPHLEELRRFKSLVERQTSGAVFVDNKPQEDNARALLQTYLRGRSYREVPVRGGKSDLLLFAEQGRFLYETKIWHGPKYYKQGLRGIEEYIIGEDDDQGLQGIFYVVFDATKTKRARAYLGDDFSTESVNDRNVDVVIINLSLPQPSKKL